MTACSKILLTCALISQALPAQEPRRAVEGVYRVFTGTVRGCDIWIVDGSVVRRDLYPEFLYGGNGQRYRFIPPHEIWIDNAIAADEYGYTIAHELHERSRMAREGATYETAHTSALGVEQKLRRADDSAARKHERELPRVSPTDCDGEKEIPNIEDSVSLVEIYRTPLGTRSGVSVWIVDGAAVRREIYPDFGLSGNDLAYHFIPRDEIWIDGQISCEETEFSIAAELRERELMMNGTSYDEAYEKAVSAVRVARKKAAQRAHRQPVLVIPKIPDREVGTGDEK